jgi:positive regulator of sigma E activity
VVEVGNEQVTFRVTGEEACETCEMAEQCYRDGGLLRIPNRELRGYPVSGLRHGQMVRLQMEHTSLLGLTGVVYGLPLALFAAGLLAGYFLLFPDAGEAGRALGSFASGVLVVAAAWAAIVRLDRRAARRIRYRVELPEEQEEDEEQLMFKEYSSEEE